MSNIIAMSSSFIYIYSNILSKYPIHFEKEAIILTNIIAGDRIFYIGDEANKLAEITYVPTGEDKIIIDHTFVSDAARGKGYGDLLVQHVADFARAEGKKIIPLCPFAKGRMEKDASYQDVLV